MAPLGVVYDFQSIVFVLSYCGLPNITDPSTFVKYWHGLTGYTMQNYYQQCSFGSVTFDPVNNTVAPRVIDVPCQGKRANGQAWDLSRFCGDAEMYGMMDYAESYARKKLRVPWPKTLKRRIAVMPFTQQCYWGGMGTLGCAGSRCNMWLHNADGTRLMPYFHEAGHTLGNQHSASRTSEYGDWTCAMGNLADACFNAPQNYWRNWATTFDGGDLVASQLPQGSWVDYDVPAQSTTNYNMLRVFLDVGGAVPFGLTAPHFYVSYRAPNPPMDAIDPQVSLHVYSYGSGKPVILGTMQPGEALNATWLGADHFVVRTNWYNATSAAVSLCRFGPDAPCVS